MRIPFAVQSYQHESKPLSAQRVVNCFSETQPRDAKAPIALLFRPGLKAYSTVGAGPIRGLHEMDEELYAVSGTALFKIDASGTATSLGSIGSNAVGLVSMADNGNQLVVVNDNTGFVYDRLLGTLVQITDGDFQETSDVAELDNYHVFIKLNTDQFFLSDLADPTSYDPLQFATAEGDPDKLVKIATDNKQLLLFGTDTTEVWYNSGSTFPFDRVSGVFLQEGLGAKYSVASLDNTVFWLSKNGIVFRLDGFTPLRVSTHAIEQAIQGYSNFGDARAFSLKWKGHVFYVLTFPDEATFVYDAATQLWHEWETFGQSGFIGSSHAQAYRKEIIGDQNSGRLYVLDDETLYDQNGVRSVAAVGTGNTQAKHQNDIPNNTMQGAVVGTIGSGGAGPTGWSFAGSSNVSIDIVATGVELDVNYIDVRLYNPTVASNSQIFLTGTTEVPAVNLDPLAMSAYLRLQAGSTAGVASFVLRHSFRDGGGGFVGSNSTADLQGSLTPGVLRDNRLEFLDVCDEPATVYSVPVLIFNWSTITTPDITLRIGLPQDELSTAATPPIRTFGTAKSRPAGLFVEGNGQSGNSLKIGGLAPEESGLLLRNDQISVALPNGTRVFTLNDDLPTSDLFGEATASITPSLPESPLDAAAVEVATYLPIQKIATGAPLYASGKKAFMPEFEAVFETGVGTTSGQGSNPQAMMEFSDDGGRTWSNSLWRDMGKIGKYQTKVVWRRLGRFEERTVRITVSDPAAFRLLGANAELIGQG